MRRLAVSIFSVLYLSLPTILLAGSHGPLIFVDDEHMMKIYHFGLPCSEPSENEYHFVIEAAAPQLVTETTAYLVQKYGQWVAKGWAFPNSCNRTSEVRLNMEFRYKGHAFASAVLDADGSRVKNVVFSRSGDPEPDAFDAKLAEILFPSGKWHGYEINDAQSADMLSFLEELRSLLPKATAEQRAHIYYRMGRYLHTYDDARVRDIRKQGGDQEAYIRSTSNSDGEQRGVALLREAAEQGHPGAAWHVYTKSGLKGYLHPYMSSRAVYDPDDEAIGDLLRRYGFVFGMAQEQKIGSLLSEISVLAQEGYSISADSVFADADLPPSGRAIEKELNAKLGEVITDMDLVATGIWSLPTKTVYDCDGTWCRIGGGYLGRVRINVKGLPDCDDPRNGKTTCRFTMFLNFDIGELGNQMPYNEDPVITFLDNFMEGAVDADLAEVEAELIRQGDKWKLVDLME